MLLASEMLLWSAKVISEKKFCTIALLIFIHFILYCFKIIGRINIKCLYLQTMHKLKDQNMLS